jgi:hypothetical protein
MTEKHIRFARALQCENRDIECITIPLHVFFRFNGLCFRVNGDPPNILIFDRARASPSTTSTLSARSALNVTG